MTPASTALWIIVIPSVLIVIVCIFKGISTDFDMEPRKKWILIVGVTVVLIIVSYIAMVW